MGCLWASISGHAEEQQREEELRKQREEAEADRKREASERQRMQKEDEVGAIPPEPKLIQLGVRESRAAKRGCFKRGGVSRSGLVLPFCPFLSFLGLSRFFRDFPDLLGDSLGIFPDSSLFSFSAY